MVQAVVKNRTKRHCASKATSIYKVASRLCFIGSRIETKINEADSSLKQIDASIIKEQAAFENLLNDGFITRIEALNNLIDKNRSVAFRYYLLVAILMLIELMPVIAKTLLPSGSYDEHAKLQEAFEIEQLQIRYQKLSNQLSNQE